MNGKKDDITPVWYCKGRLRFVPLANFRPACNCGTQAFEESTGGCPEHGVYIDKADEQKLSGPIFSIGYEF